ncbi:MAG: hypothetical protein KJI71_00540 [Patescibacteria group bacterium]|nr:hypothetical protein [Patescibacteria group bacterium]
MKSKRKERIKLGKEYKKAEYINIESKIVVCPKCKTYTVPETTSGDYPLEIMYICQSCRSVYNAIAKIEIFKDCDVCDECEDCEMV